MSIVSPSPRVYEPITTIESLKEHLQAALWVEFSTIPPYLTALYSIKDKSSYAYQVIRGVALEEMLHCNLVANLMNAIDAKPRFYGEEMPAYPTYIPGHAAGGPFIQLMAASQTLMRETFMAIEKPAPMAAPQESSNFQTIGQFYKAIEMGFENCVKRYGEEAVFSGKREKQRGDFYIGSGGGRPIIVTCLKTAKLAILEIVQQGEGAETPTQDLVAKQPWGAKNHYGMRSDNTYGPIMGVPFELSHYRKFELLANGTVPLGDVYPMQANPKAENYTGDAAQLAHVFNHCYSLMLIALEAAFDDHRRSFFTVVFPIMQNVLPPLAVKLMTTPLLAESDANLGPTAGPPFEWEPKGLSAIINQVNPLAKGRKALVPKPVIDELNEINEKCKAAGLSFEEVPS